MTKREVYEAVIANQNVSEEIRSYFEDELVKMDERNRRNAEKRAEKAKENEPIKAAIFEVLGEEPKTATIALIMAQEEPWGEKSPRKRWINKR